ncbi:MAG: hypothetical protein R3B45_14290 [Bdellovibrionota bacterium]
MVNRNKFSSLVAARVCQIVNAFKVFNYFKYYVFYLLIYGCSSALSGNLKTLDEQPIDYSNARVNIVPLDVTSKSQGGKSGTVNSTIVAVSNDGSFIVNKSLKKGRYLVEALVPGFKLASAEIDLNKTDKIVLDLMPNPIPDASMIGVNPDVNANRGIGGASLTPPRL